MWKKLRSRTADEDGQDTADSKEDLHILFSVTSSETQTHNDNSNEATGRLAEYLLHYTLGPDLTARLRSELPKADMYTHLSDKVKSSLAESKKPWKYRLGFGSDHSAIISAVKTAIQDTLAEHGITLTKGDWRDYSLSKTSDDAAKDALRVFNETCTSNRVVLTVPWLPHEEQKSEAQSAAAKDKA